MSKALDEIMLHLHDTTVKTRLYEQEVDFVVSKLGAVEAKEAEPVSTGTQSNGDATRITLRLPEYLKESVEQAAKYENLSVIGCLARAIAPAIVDGSVPRDHSRYGKRNRNFRGFTRS